MNPTMILNTFARCITKTIQKWSRARGYETGMILFFHAFGSRLQQHPHFHVVVTSGGIKPNGEWHYTDVKMPGHILMPIFRAKFSDAIKQLYRKRIIVTKEPLPKIIAMINKAYKYHWQFYTERMINRGFSNLLYCVRYAKKMIMSENRIVTITDKSVAFWSKSHKHKDRVLLEYKIDQFIGCLLRNIPPKQFRLIRTAGIYANRSGKKYKQALKYFNKMKAYVALKKWRNRQWLRDGVDPLTCPNCDIELKLRKFSYPKKWYTFTINKIKESIEFPLQMKMKIDYG
jgi:hypothetical protein